MTLYLILLLCKTSEGRGCQSHLGLHPLTDIQADLTDVPHCLLTKLERLYRKMCDPLLSFYLRMPQGLVGGCRDLLSFENHPRMGWSHIHWRLLQVVPRRNATSLAGIFLSSETEVEDKIAVLECYQLRPCPWEFSPQHCCFLQRFPQLHWVSEENIPQIPSIIGMNLPNVEA